MADAELRKFFGQLMKTVDGLHAIIVTDRDGVPIVKVATEDAPEQAMRPRFLSTAATAMDQASKLGVSHNTSVVAVYSNYQVVTFNKLPLLVTLIAGSEANTGMMLALEQEMQDTLEDIRAAVDGS